MVFYLEKIVRIVQTFFTSRHVSLTSMAHTSPLYPSSDKLTASYAVMLTLQINVFSDDKTSKCLTLQLMLMHTSNSLEYFSY